MGIGTNTPAVTLEVNGNLANRGYRTLEPSTSSFGLGMITTSDVIIGAYIAFFGNNAASSTQRGGVEYVYDTRNSGNGGFNLIQTDGFAYTRQLKVFPLTGNLVLQNGGTFTDAGYRLDVNGTARVSGAATFSSSVTVSSLNINNGDTFINVVSTLRG